MSSEYNSATERQRWLSVMAKSDLAALAARMEAIVAEVPTPTWLRAPQTGLVMVRGRVGGTGAQLNLGELAVTRCTVQVGRQVGQGWVKGTSVRHAELIAIADALLQDSAWNERIGRAVIQPLAAALVERDQRARAAVAPSKVEFLTMVRGA